MATIRDSVLQPITVTAEQKAEFMSKLRELSDEGAVFILPPQPDAPQPSEIMNRVNEIARAATAELLGGPTPEEQEKARLLEEELNARTVALPGEIPAGFPIVGSISADPAIKATTKAEKSR